MSLNRRNFLASTAALAGASLVPRAVMAADTIKLGSILDTSGIFDAYGKPMDMAVRLAVDEINAGGGLLASRLRSWPMTPNPTWRFIRNMVSN